MFTGKEQLSGTDLDVETMSSDLMSGIYRMRFRSISVSVKYRRGTGDTLLVFFHGAIDRSKHQIPKWQGPLPDLDECHQLSIADPTLELHPHISAGWYLGGSGLPLQAELPQLIKCMSDRLATQRHIYIGGSSGGFAALYYSFCDPGSVCIAVNPQTNLLSYRNAERQLRLIYPVDSIIEIGNRIIINLNATYDKGYKNLIIYLQSNGDLRHFSTQMPEFCNSCLKQPEHFILQCNYWGVPGHSGSIPINVYREWIKAVLKATWFDRQGILDATHSIVNQQNSPTQALQLGGKATNPHIGSTYDTQSIRTATILRDHHLS